MQWLGVDAAGPSDPVKFCRIHPLLVGQLSGSIPFAS